MRRKIVAFVFGVVGIITVSCTHSLVVENNPGEVFRVFWETMDQRYVNFAEHPLDWDSIWTEYYPKACQAQSERELEYLFAVLINDLQDGHVALLGRAGEGLCTACTGGPADSDPYKDTVYTCLAYRYTPLYVREPVYSGIITPITGIHGISPATLDTCAYISIAGFVMDQTDVYAYDAINSVLRYRPKGWIVDLRGNKGGSASATTNFCSYFYTGERQLLQLYARTSRGDRYTLKEVGDCTLPGQGLVSEDIPVIVIVDYSVWSAANVCTYILSEFPNVTVIGPWGTFGGGATPTYTRLPNGWHLWAPIEDKVVVNNQSAEYRFQPDSVVDASHSCFLSNLKGIDTALDLSTYVALSLIDKENHE